MDAYRPRMSHPLLDRKVHKVSSPTVERPAWDDSQHNLSVYSLTVEEQVRTEFPEPKLSEKTPKQTVWLRVMT